MVRPDQNSVIFGPAPSYVVLPAHALQRARRNSSQRSSRRVVMSGMQEDDLVDKACVYLGPGKSLP